MYTLLPKACLSVFRELLWILSKSCNSKWMFFMFYLPLGLILKSPFCVTFSHVLLMLHFLVDSVLSLIKSHRGRQCCVQGFILVSSAFSAAYETFISITFPSSFSPLLLMGVTFLQSKAVLYKNGVISFAHVDISLYNWLPGDAGLLYSWVPWNLR